MRTAALALAALLPAALSYAAPGEAALQRGEQVYARCIGCHAVEGNRTGPQHCGVFGRRAGTAPGYDAYSQAMRNSRIVWTEATLDAFLRDPAALVPGTTMGYAGIKDARERADLLAWLKAASQAPAACRVQR
ncbi:c-type cytochrome [Aquabacterium sp. A7-Y]|uniref:c-type cytochrome n=1 Tax=Aquabacterium sp. A7-Y TaxID=1349605 RepID=UPI00223DEA40|nr:c-type cytochrome [Aquabacterium sp. A7-Y]MCW7537816.1 c-type cytochrome [Aquabacterium sp. A7-Y]